MPRPLDDRDRRLLAWIASTLVAEHLAGVDGASLGEHTPTDPVAASDDEPAAASCDGDNERS
jgi:hypothetical protein